MKAISHLATPSRQPRGLLRRLVGVPLVQWPDSTSRPADIPSSGPVFEVTLRLTVMLGEGNLSSHPTRIACRHGEIGLVFE